MQQAKIRRDTARGLRAIGTFFGYAAFVIGFILLIWSSGQWLKTAKWSAANGWTLASLLEPDSWVWNPHDLLGLHKVVSHVLNWPLFVTLPIVLGLCAGIFHVWANDFDPESE